MFERQIFRALLIAIVLLGGAPGLRGASGIKVVKLIVTNPQSVARADVPFVVSVEAIQKIAPDFDGKSFIVTTSGTASLAEDAAAIKFRPVSAQADDLNGDGKADEIAFTMNLASR